MLALIQVLTDRIYPVYSFQFVNLFIQSVMVNQGVWRAGIYDSEECNDPNVFYTLLGQHFHRRDVAEIIHAFSELTLVVKYPLDLLRATAQVNNFLRKNKINNKGK